MSTASTGPPWTKGYILADPYLEYYYRMDMGGFAFPTSQPYTDDFILDHSGKPGNRNLQAVNQNENHGGTGAVFTTDTEILPYHVAGAPDDDAPDLAAMQFNYLEFQWISWGWQVGLVAQHDFPMERQGFRSGGGDVPVGGGSMFIAWVAYVADGPIDVDPYDPENPPTMPVISTWFRQFGVGDYGAQLGFYPSTGELYYLVGGAVGQPGFSWRSGGGFGEGSWVHFASRIEKITDSTFRRTIWIGDTAHTTVEGDATATGATYEGGAPLSFGTAHWDDVREGHGRGMVDGVAYFSFEPRPPTRESWGIIAR